MLTLLDMVVHTSNPSTRETEAGVSLVQRQPQLLRELKVILAYLRPCVIYKLRPKLIKDWWGVFFGGSVLGSFMSTEKKLVIWKKTILRKCPHLIGL